MINSVIQQLPAVLFETQGTAPEESNETHVLLSIVALNVGLASRPLRMLDSYCGDFSLGKIRGTLDLVFRADQELDWERLQELLLAIHRRTQAIEWYLPRNSNDAELDCKTREISIKVYGSAFPLGSESKVPDAGVAAAPSAVFDSLLVGMELLAGHRAHRRVRLFDFHCPHYFYLPYSSHEVLPSAEDGGPALEPAPGSLCYSYAEYLSFFQERAQEPLPAPSDQDEGDEAPREVALRTRAYFWHCCAWAHFKLGQLDESQACFEKATATPYDRFKDLQRNSRCPVPGIAPYPDQEYLLWQIEHQLSRGYPWQDGNMERLYWLSMALTAVSAEKIPDLARLFSEYLGLMLQVQYYFVVNLKTQAYAILIRDCEAAQRQAPAEHKELYWTLNYNLQIGRVTHIDEHPTATDAEKDAVQNLYGEFLDKRALENHRRDIQHYVGS